MIGFSGGDVIFSAFCALIYGGIYSIVYQFIIIFLRITKSIPGFAMEIADSNKILPVPSIRKRIINCKEGGGVAFFSVILYFVGFMLLSYFSLDGQLRLYMLILSSASLYVLNSTFSAFSKTVIVFLLDVFFCAFSFVLRLIIIPLKLIFLFIKRKVRANK